MNEDKFRNFVKENSKYFPERPTNEWEQIASKVEGSITGSSTVSLRVIFGGFGAVAAAALAIFFIATSDTVDSTHEASDQEIAEFLFEDGLEDEVGQEYSETYIALIE